MTDRSHIEDDLNQALADLADIDRQLAEGEIDTATRDRLAAVYRGEVDDAKARLERSPGSRGKA